MASQVLLEFKNISKAFGDCIANRGVSFSVNEGSIHALVGENGAGKSTIMKILFGLYHQDQGDIYYRGNPVKIKNPIDAKNLGIGMVHQHFVLAGPLSAIDHVILDDPSEASFFTPLNRKKKLSQLEALSNKFKMPLEWLQPVEKLTVGFQQRLEILKLLHNQAKILILDEPTAVLSPQESEALYQQLLELKKQGHTIFLVTHKLKDVFKYADDVTVFRMGATLGTFKTNETNIEAISELMIGRSLQKFESNSQQPSSNICIDVNNLTCSALKLKNLNFKIFQSEILGIAGIEGNGQSDLIQLLMQPKKFRFQSGSVTFLQNDILKMSTLEIRRSGIAYFPEDRLRQGSIGDFDLQENFLLGQQFQKTFNNSGWIDRKNLEWNTKASIKDFDIRPGILQQQFSELSGGNQQKLVVARELFMQPQLLIAAQPTRGVDIGAIERIHSEMVKLKNKGSGILLISSDLDELIKLSDRILVMFQGKIVGEFIRGQFDEFAIGKHMTGGMS